MISIDTETTGTSFYHGNRPFMVTTCDENDEQTTWVWEVDPYTRMPSVDKDDIEQIKNIVKIQKNWGEFDNDTRERHTLVLQNSKFDVTGLGFVDEWFRINWPWEQTRDTIIAGHLLHSGRRHNLTAMVSDYLGIDIQPQEDKLATAVKKARSLARRKFPDWEIARYGHPMLPSIKKSSKDDKIYHSDYWLPRAMVVEMGYDKVAREIGDDNHEWDTVCQQYADADSYFTLKLWQTMAKMLRERDLWEIFAARMKLLPVAFRIEHRGVSFSGKRLAALKDEYEQESQICESVCVNVAQEFQGPSGPYILAMPKSGKNDSIRDFVFRVLKLPKKKEESLDKTVIQEFADELEPNTIEHTFVCTLLDKSKRDTALQYMEGYERFKIQSDKFNGWYTLHPSLNPTGTAHLRWSCKNPNEQNISKQKGFNLRYAFGPGPGREWWSLDAQNIELRIPAFKADEQDVVNIFLRPNDPPYYGSYHLAVFDTLYPDIFKKFGKEVKDMKEYESTLYQWVKNGNFAILYGAGEAKADATYHYKGAFQLIRRRFPKIAKLSDRMIAEANRTGGIHTVPDNTVNPKKGYPIQCSFGDYARVQPTLPLNYFVSGTACWWMGQAMVACDEQLETWRTRDKFDGGIAMQVHDELVFDLPKRGNPVTDAKNSNLNYVKVLQKHMERQGDAIGVPTPVALEFNEYTWDKGVRV